MKVEIVERPKAQPKPLTLASVPSGRLFETSIGDVCLMASCGTKYIYLKTGDWYFTTSSGVVISRILPADAVIRIEV